MMPGTDPIRAAMAAAPRRDRRPATIVHHATVELSRKLRCSTAWRAGLRTAAW